MVFIEVVIRIKPDWGESGFLLDGVCPMFQLMRQGNNCVVDIYFGF